jgi:hypothetical protein
MPREEIQRSPCGFYIIQESRTIFSWIGKGWTSDLQMWKALLKMLGSHFIKLMELLQWTSPAAGICLPSITWRIQIRFIPDFPILDVPMMSVCPSLIVMTDYVFADLSPLLEILWRIDTIFL